MPSNLVADQGGLAALATPQHLHHQSGLLRSLAQDRLRWTAHIVRRTCTVLQEEGAGHRVQDRAVAVAARGGGRISRRISVGSVLSRRTRQLLLLLLLVFTLSLQTRHQAARNYHAVHRSVGASRSRLMVVPNLAAMLMSRKRNGTTSGCKLWSARQSSSCSTRPRPTCA